MLNGLKAWMEILKLGPVIKLSKEMNAFYRNTVLEVFRDEGWFDYLASPRTLDDIATRFNITDKDLLSNILNTLVQDGIVKENRRTFQVSRQVVIRKITPRLLSQGNIDISLNYARFLPRRLRGEYYSATSGFNLYSFDEALMSNLYRQIRKTIVTFGGMLEKKGRFLDVGTGSGVGLSHIFSMYLQKGALDNSHGPLEFHGIDTDEDLLKIASEEFFRRAAKESNLDLDQVQKYARFKPTFKVGTATQIPYPDNFFDIVYISQVLHWTNPALAIREMYRVTKDGGMVVGGQILKPRADEYLNIVMMVLKGAHGFFTKDEMKQWSSEAGFKRSSFGTPVTTFVLRK